MLYNTTTSSQLSSSDNYYPHIRPLLTHPHLLCTDFIHLLLVATSGDLQIRLNNFIMLAYCSHCVYNVYKSRK